MINRYLCLILSVFLFSFRTNSQIVHKKDFYSEFKEIHKDSILKKVEFCLTLSNQYPNLSNKFNSIVNSVIETTSAEKLKTKLYILILRNDIVTKKFQNITNIQEQAISYVETYGDLSQKSKLFFYIGSYFIEYLHDYKQATGFFIKSLKYAEKDNNEYLKNHCYSSLGKLYQMVNKLDSAKVYFKLSLSYFEKIKDTSSLSIAYLNLGSASVKNKTQSEHYFNKAVMMAVACKNKSVELTALYNLANIQERYGDIKLAEKLTEELIKKIETGSDKSLLLNTQALLATIKYDSKKYKEAIDIAKEIYPDFEKQHNTQFQITILDILENSYEQKKDYKNAYCYAKLQQNLRDSITTLSQNNYLEELKAKYNIEKKDDELRFKNQLLIESKKTEKQKNIAIIALCVSLISIVAFSLIYVKQRKSKQESIQKEKEYTTQLQNFESFINGQETERTRIASDLHDGLAQNLVMLNLELSSLKNNNVTERIIFLQNEVNKMINETRKIAHNMMPDVLVDLGLPKALKSLIAKLNESITEIKFTLTVTEPFTNIDKNTEVQLYRMAQELLSNTIKHSGANKCDIQLESSLKKIRLVVKDNGKGMRINDESENGIGLKNLLTRTHSLKGQLTIQTPENEGVLISINIPTKNSQNG